MTPQGKFQARPKTLIVYWTLITHANNFDAEKWHYMLQAEYELRLNSAYNFSLGFQHHLSKSE